MKKKSLFLCLLFLAVACKVKKTPPPNKAEKSDFTIAFGSCNKHTSTNFLWEDIIAQNPSIWVWGGDIVYADTDDMNKLRSAYAAQNEVAAYRALKAKVPIIGTWDDHDYGLNDGGEEFTAKKESQKELLDFLGVATDSPRRVQEGVYAAHDYELPKGTVKIIVLDTRYFRTPVTPDTETKKRLKPNTYGEGTILGATQWRWLEHTLQASKADFNVIVSSIQFLSDQHGFECWGNFPHEADRLKKMIVDTKANGVVILSGDRHISEFSRTAIENGSYPLIDFTSSGLTHAYSKFDGEPNPFRVGEVVSQESFGVLQFDFEKKQVLFKIIGDQGAILEVLQQTY